MCCVDFGNARTHFLPKMFVLQSIQWIIMYVILSIRSIPFRGVILRLTLFHRFPLLSSMPLCYDAFSLSSLMAHISINVSVHSALISTNSIIISAFRPRKHAHCFIYSVKQTWRFTWLRYNGSLTQCPI